MGFSPMLLFWVGCLGIKGLFSVSDLCSHCFRDFDLLCLKISQKYSNRTGRRADRGVPAEVGPLLQLSSEELKLNT